MRVLIVCSGNICRSPLAAALLRHKAAAAHLPLEVKSAGTAASTGHPMSVPMEMILQERGINIHHSSQRISQELIDWADVILTMTRAHKAILMATVAWVTPKLFTLNEYGDDLDNPDIDDPLGTHLEGYRQCAQEIEEGCDRTLIKLSQPSLLTSANP